MKLHWSCSFVREMPINKGGLARDIHPTSHRYPYKRNVMLCQQMKRTVQVCGLRKAITIYERERAVCCPEKGNKSKPWPICLWRGNNSEILINFLCLHMFPFHSYFIPSFTIENFIDSNIGSSNCNAFQMSIDNR